MRRIRLLWLLPAAFALSSCEDFGACLQAPEGYAATPDEAVNFYRAAFMQRDPFALEQLLSDEFRYRIAATDADSLGIAREWDKKTDLQWAKRMLDGVTSGSRVDSLPQCPLDLTFFVSIPPLDGSSWKAVTSGPFAGCQVRDFGSIGQVGVGTAGLDFFQGNHRVYVRQERIPKYDCMAYRIYYWDDLGTASAGKHGFFTWGRVRARWRPGAPPPKELCS